jgi:formate dehydrogenase subunit beta
VRDLLNAVWLQANLAQVLVSGFGSHDDPTVPRLLSSPDQLANTNPFSPLMTENAACLLPGLLADHPTERLGVVLRPCEMRSWIEVVKRAGLDTRRMLTIAVDCLGTFPPEEYAWRARRKESAAHLTQEALQFSHTGGIVPYRYRAACQMCVMPIAQHAAVNVHVLGLPVRQWIHLSLGDRAEAWGLQADRLAQTRVTGEALLEYERAADNIASRRKATRQRVVETLAEALPRDVETLVEVMAECQDCQRCLAACPMCTVSFPRQDTTGMYVKEDLMNWLVSCSGCGMCEQECPRHLPLTVIFSTIHQQLAEITAYEAGASWETGLPVF